MRCSASGSTTSPSQAWWPAPPRCLWSTGASAPKGGWLALASGPLPGGLRVGAQRFDFLAFFFFLATFFTAFFAAFLTAFLADFFADFFAADFLPAFLAFLAFFGITFLATRLAAFLTFLTAVLTASVVALAALPIASVVCSRIGLSSSISSPRVYRSHNDSGIRQAVKETRRAYALRTLA